MFSAGNQPAGIGERINVRDKRRSLIYSVVLTIVFLINGVLAGRASAVSPQISAGYFHSLALHSDGTLWAWGFNGYGQLGDGTNTNSDYPKQIGSESSWALIAAGYFHNFALKSDGTLWAWGNNLSGQLGDGTNTNSVSPKQIGSDMDWISLAGGYYHSLALKSDGTLWAWGYNGKGQLGDGTTTNSTTPKQIGSDRDWVSIAAGYLHSLALKSDGTLWAWGYNGNGQLGDGTTSNSTSPKQIGSDMDWVSITAGYYYSLAIKSDGTLWAWGYNGYGQLGDGTTTNGTSPEQIGSDTDWVSIAAGDYHSLALKSDDTLWAWGYNDNGQLGICSTNNATSPVPIRCDLVTDLIIHNITTDPVNPGVGQNITVTITVTNQGTLASGQFMIDFYKDLPAGVIPNPPGDSEDFWCTVVGLSAGATDLSCAKSVTYSNAGTYNIWAYVDSNQNISESNEVNNVYGPHAIAVCNLNTYYYDADTDGYGDPNSATQACYQPAGYVTNSLDCDDADSTINPYTSEICDNKDNDCNGLTDDGIASIPTTCGVGECMRTGINSCTNGAWVDTCIPGAPVAETCDNKDNNCDGVIDNNLTRATTCGTGSCSSTGIETCSAGMWGNDTCTVKQPSVEICNNIDDDCDGIIDNNLTRPTTCGAGACSSTGIETCSAGVWGNDTCTAKPPAVETCNNIDDDCDGQVDEDYIPVVTSCGQGICAATGQLICQNGLEVDTCIIGQPTENNETTCNDSIDNDCDGFTDGNDPDCTPTSDLAVASVSKPPAKRKRGRSFKVIAKVRNKGVGAADKDFAIGYYLSKNREKLVNKEADIFLTDDLIVSSLLAGSRSKVRIHVNIPMDTPKGKYYVKVCADNRNDIREINEENNCKASRNKIRIK